MRLGPYLLGPNDTAENGIYTGDARILSDAIPDESVDLIFTDPVYQNIDDYRWLAETATRVLRRQGIIFAYYWGSFAPFVVAAMTTPGLVFRSPVFDLKIGVASLDGGRNGRIMTRPALVWSKEEHNKSFWLDDVVYSRPMGKQVNHQWSKNPSAARQWLRMIPIGITVDFFCGGGTHMAVCKETGRHYLAFEIDPDTADRARERVRNTQPPLFVPEPQQLSFEEGGDKNGIHRHSNNL